MKRGILIACLLAATVAGCGTVKKVMTPRAQEAATPAPQNNGGPITLSGTPNLSSPAPVQQTTPRAQNWRRDLPRNIAYFNMGSSAVTIYGEADRTTTSGQLLPGEGGFIQTCDDSKPICKMNFGNGRSGWVSMSTMAGVSS